MARKKRNMVFLSFLFATMLLVQSFPQSFAKGEESCTAELNKVIIDKDGNLYVVGDFFDYDYLRNYYALQKYSPDGELLWSVFNDPASNWSSSVDIAIDSSNNLYMSEAKYLHVDDLYNYLIKIKSDGQEEWRIDVTDQGSIDKITISHDFMFTIQPGLNLFKRHLDSSIIWDLFIRSGHVVDLIVDGFGNSYIASFNLHDSYVSGLNQYNIVKIDPSGNILWGNDEIVYGIEVDIKGNIYVSHQDIANYSLAGSLRKYDSFGNLMWSYDDEYEYQEFTIDKEGNLYALGREYTEGPDEYVKLLKLASDGNELWSDIIFVGEYDLIHWKIGKLAVFNSQDIYIIAYNNVQGESGNALIRRYYSDGSLIWSKTEYPDFYALYLEVDNTGEAIYISGEVSWPCGDGGGGWKTVKLDSDGNELWSVEYFGEGACPYAPYDDCDDDSDDDVNDDANDDLNDDADSDDDDFHADDDNNDDDSDACACGCS